MNVCGLLACKKMWLFFVVQDSDTYHGFGQWICCLSDSYWAQMMAVIVSDITRDCASKFSWVLHRKMAQTYDHQEFQVPKME